MLVKVKVFHEHHLTAYNDPLAIGELWVNDCYVPEATKRCLGFPILDSVNYYFDFIIIVVSEKVHLRVMFSFWILLRIVLTIIMEKYLHLRVMFS